MNNLKFMPESPEVETIARNLREGTAGCFALPGLTISGIKLSWHKTLAEPAVEIIRTIAPRSGGQGRNQKGQISGHYSQQAYNSDPLADVWRSSYLCR